MNVYRLCISLYCLLAQIVCAQSVEWPIDPSFDVRQTEALPPEHKLAAVDRWKRLPLSRKYLVARALVRQHGSVAERDSNRAIAMQLTGARLPASQQNSAQPQQSQKQFRMEMKELQKSFKSKSKPVLSNQQRDELIGEGPIVLTKKGMSKQLQRFVTLLDHWFPVGKRLDELTQLVGAPLVSENGRYLMNFDPGIGGVVYFFEVEDAIIQDFGIFTSN